MKKPLSRFFNVTYAIAVVSAALSTWAVHAQTQPSNKPPTEKPKDWRIVAKEDIAAAYQSTFLNHPGMVDPINPKFGDTLEAARRAALKLAGQYDSAASYRAALAVFRAQLNDGHAGAYTRVPPEWLPPLRWPGFVTTWRSDGLFVSRSEAKQISVGTRVVGCDGQTIEDLVKNNVFRFKVGANQAGHWWTQASRVFVDDGNPFVRLPQRCEFELLDRKQSLEISWLDAPPELEDWRSASVASTRFSTQLQELAPGIAWISLPTFDPNPEQLKALEALYKTLGAKNSLHVNAKAIVIDLRGNQGGSSNWSLRLARALWGAKAVDAHHEYANRKVQILWRPTEGNEAAMRSYLPIFLKQGQKELAAEIKKTADQMNKARALNEALMPERVAQKTNSVKSPAKPLMGANNKLTPLYVITDGDCASACLDAVDIFKLYSNTILVGSPTASDSTYMEVRTDPLPSGFGATIIPMKIWVNRPRGNGQFYTPDIVINDLEWTSDSFLNRIQEDLTNRAPK